MAHNRERAMATLEARPSLPSHVRIQFDPIRQATSVLAPEKVFWPNEISLDILRKCSGNRTVAEIIAELATEYEADPADISGDIISFLQEWSDNLLVRL